MSKRQKFVASTLILSGGFFLAQFIDFSFRYPAIAALSFVSFVLSIWCLKDGLGKNATLLTLILPVFYTIGTQLFYLGLENNGLFSGFADYIQIAVRVLLIAFYALGTYALLLTANIYTVAAARTIQLLRAAHAVGFLLTLVSGFFAFNVVLSFYSDFWFNGLIIGLLSVPLFLQGFWSIELEPVISKELLSLSLGMALVVAEIAAVLSFWPITVVVFSLAVTTVMYVGLGLGQALLQQRLFEKTVKEYLLVGVIVLVTMFLTAKWGG